MALSFIFSIDKNFIQIYNNKNIKLFCQNFIDITLKTCQSVSQPEKYYLILEIIISSQESYFSFIFFINAYLIISIHKVKLSKPSSLFQSI